MQSKNNIVITYVVLVFIWATTPLAIVWSVSDIYILWAMALRFFIALPIAALLLLLLKVKFPLDKIALHSYVAGSFSLIGSQIFTYIATQYLSSGILALMFGLAPIIAGLMAHFALGQHLNRLQWLGMFVAICGLALICFGGSTQNIHPIGIALMLISVFMYCLSIFWVKKVNAEVEPMAQATGSILVSALGAICLMPWIWQYAPTHLPEAKSLFALMYTVIMASLIAMFCYFKLVRSIKATTLSLTNVMTPLLAMFIGVLINHEKLSILGVVGTVIILTGLFLYFYKDLQASRRLQSHLKHQHSEH
ncbi:EamA family transporter [Acinetobacter sp. S40]|uniref:DMT family transporter n=1 Tax=unclassified Acinetobacter TaxID=196816 RepID=UPI00190D2488|nr:MULTISPECIES: EamA family transporter [unclassified Acinetobacter]MBJ9986377.1 EamA family transporter [Acinetobacter sp. S40]MBK0063650.1 EamA family transporter [Acinetobacter sp. S55]MBK0067528.1 EamA family transporter [Acinetobacter sp. S54]